MILETIWMSYPRGRIMGYLFAVEDEDDWKLESAG